MDNCIYNLKKYIKNGNYKKLKLFLFFFVKKYSNQKLINIINNENLLKYAIIFNTNINVIKLLIKYDCDLEMDGLSLLLYSCIYYSNIFDRKYFDDVYNFTNYVEVELLDDDDSKFSIECINNIEKQYELFRNTIKLLKKNSSEDEINTILLNKQNYNIKEEFIEILLELESITKSASKIDNKV